MRFPPAAGLLVAVTAAVHAIDFLAGGALLRAGANSSAVWDGEAYRLLSAVFLHINLPHLLVNMSGLYLFGRVVEAAVGPRRFLGVYLISGLTGSVVSLLAAPGAQAAGASGAIFGLVGWVLHFRLRRLERRWLPIDSILIQILVLNVLLALVLPNLDHAGHLGGLAGGALAGSLLGLHRPGERRPNVRESSAAALALGILIWVGLNPLSAAAAIDPVAPASARWMESRFGHYFIETRTAGASVWWRYADEPIAWRPMERQIVLRPDRPVQFAAAWRGSRPPEVPEAAFMVEWRQNGSLRRREWVLTQPGGQGGWVVRAGMPAIPADASRGTWSVRIVWGRQVLLQAVWEARLAAGLV